MDLWLGGSEVYTRLGYKILIGGLSEAGKTAVKRIFFMKQQVEDVDRLTATIDYERLAISISNIPITIVDLGGQRVFIKRFLSNFSPFVFSSVHVFIFVIDVSVKSTRNNAIQYFASCVERLKEFSPDAEFFVFLHKNDLVINLPNYESIHSQLKEQFQLECPKRIRFLRTTIYRPETVINAFGRTFELALPDLALSEFVDGKTIGEVEEHAERYAALELQDACCPKCGNNFVDIDDGLLCNFCGYKRSLGYTPVSATGPADTASDSVDHRSASLEDLKERMEESMVNEGENNYLASFITTDQLTDAANRRDESAPAAIGKLQSLLDDILIKDGSNEKKSTVSPMITEKKALHSTPLPLTYLRDAALEETSEETVLTPISKSPMTDEIEKIDSSVNMNVSYLVKFYGIKGEEAMKLVESGHSSMFETAARAGVPISLLLNVFMKYIPYLSKKDLIIENFEDRLMEVFFAHLNKLIKENDIFDCLILAAKNPGLSIEEIAKKHLMKEREEKERKQIVAAPDTVISASDIPTSIHTDELDESVIPLSSRGKIGFKAEKVDSNCRLVFYHGNHRLGSNLVAKFVSIHELKYLLAFEAQLPIEGDKKEFVEEAAPIILETISDMFKKVEVPQITTTQQKPIDIKTGTHSPFIKLLEGHQVFFEVKVVNNLFQINFEIKSRDVGQIEVPMTITAIELMEEIRIKTLLMAIIPDDDLIFATQAVFSVLKNLTKNV
ncbi:MAG: ADP-ribosylation factor-like protein [Candidatus Hodarchaeales archaeon]|jgi:GTPase SAR1 family protein